MAKPSRQQSDDDDALSGEDQLQMDVEEEEEEIEAIALSASYAADGDDAGDDGTDERDEDEKGDSEVGIREKEKLREMQELKKQKVQEIFDAQNTAIDANMNNKGKGRLNYLLQQTEIFAHFTKGSQLSSRKTKGRGRHASKLTEEEEDEECLKEEEDDLSGAGTTWLTKPKFMPLVPTASVSEVFEFILRA